MMKKRMLTLVLALMMCLILIPTTAFAAEDIAKVDKITIRFERAGHTYEMTFTDVADMVVNYTEDGDTWPNTIFYYPGATVSVSETLDNTDNFTNGFFLEANYHFRGNGRVKANTQYNIEAVYEKLFYILAGDDAKIENSTGTLGLGPVFLSRVEQFGQYSESHAPIYDYEVKAADNPLDLPSSWAVKQVNAAIAAGLVPENLQKSYNSAVSRGAVAQMFINLIEQSAGQTIEDFMAEKNVTVNNNAFIDTSDKAVLAANALGIINGVGDNRFNPDGILTRGQIAAIINRTARVLGVNTNGYSHSFTDVAGHWVDGELGWPVHADIINGVGNNKYDPDSSLTTEQAIVIAYRALKVFNAADLDAPYVSAGCFDWVDVATTYDGILRPYAESLGFECECRQATDMVNGGTRYYLYFTKGDTRVAVIPKPASNYYSVRVGRPDDSNSTRIEDGVLMKNYATSSEVKEILKSAL